MKRRGGEHDPAVRVADGGVFAEGHAEGGDRADQRRPLVVVAHFPQILGERTTGQQMGEQGRQRAVGGERHEVAVRAVPAGGGDGFGVGQHEAEEGAGERLHDGAVVDALGVRGRGEGAEGEHRAGAVVGRRIERAADGDVGLAGLADARAEAPREHALGNAVGVDHVQAAAQRAVEGGGLQGHGSGDAGDGGGALGGLGAEAPDGPADGAPRPSRAGRRRCCGGWRRSPRRCP